MEDLDYGIHEITIFEYLIVMQLKRILYKIYKLYSL